jgi:hypothetical protein
MKKTYCDLCGKETSEDGYHIEAMIDEKEKGIIGHETKEFDLCNGCYEKLEDYIEKNSLK